MTWRLCVIRKDPELLTDIRDFTTLSYVILRRKSEEWLESSMQNNLGMRFSIWSHDLANGEFPFFKHSF